MLARPTDINGRAVSVEPVTVTQPERTHAFVRAQRHSRTVGVLKGALPALAILMAVGFIGYSYLATPSALAISSDGSAVSNGQLVMANPKLDGFTKDNRPYSMTAQRAIQDFKNQGVVNLEDIAARLPIDDENWAKIDAASGIYDRDKNTLDINSDVTITTADGMVVKLKSAHLDIGKGSMTSSDPVDIQTAGARITSDAMSIHDSGKILIFDKRVRMNIDPTRMKTDKQANGDLDAGN